jgi:ABC-type phosphate transport system auxiliary subunit
VIVQQRPIQGSPIKGSPVRVEPRKSKHQIADSIYARLDTLNGKLAKMTALDIENQRLKQENEQLKAEKKQDGGSKEIKKDEEEKPEKN